MIGPNGVQTEAEVDGTMPSSGVMLEQRSGSVVSDGEVLVGVAPTQNVAIARVVLTNVRRLSAKMIAESLEQSIAATKRPSNVFDTTSRVPDDVHAMMFFRRVE